jgi:uncharacterized protein (DUF2062 family)
VTASTFRRASKRFRASFADLSPQAIALILVVGLVLGVFPVFGLPTLLCAAEAVILGWACFLRRHRQACLPHVFQ